MNLRSEQSGYRRSISLLIASSEEFKALLLLRGFIEEAAFHSTVTTGEIFLVYFKKPGAGKRGVETENQAITEHVLEG